MTKEIFGHNPPPPLASQLFSPKPGRVHKLYVMDGWSGVWIHWIGKRSVPCLGDNCPKTLHRRPALWRGYLPAALWETAAGEQSKPGWRSVVFSISPEQADELRPAVEKGERLALHVQREKVNGPVLIESRILKATPEDLPPIADVQATLLRVWKIRPPTAEDR